MPSRAGRGVETGRGGGEIASVGPESSAHAAPTQFRIETMEAGTDTCRESWEPGQGDVCHPSHMGEQAQGDPSQSVPSNTGELQERNSDVLS